MKTRQKPFYGNRASVTVYVVFRLVHSYLACVFSAILYEMSARHVLDFKWAEIFCEYLFMLIFYRFPIHVYSLYREKTYQLHFTAGQSTMYLGEKVGALHSFGKHPHPYQNCPKTSWHRILAGSKMQLTDFFLSQFNHNILVEKMGHSSKAINGEN